MPAGRAGHLVRARPAAGTRRAPGQPPRSVYLDLANHYVTQEQDNTPFTPAVQVLHAMRQALRELEKEGVPERIARYARERAGPAPRA